MQNWKYVYSVATLLVTLQTCLPKIATQSRAPLQQALIIKEVYHIEQMHVSLASLLYHSTVSVSLLVCWSCCRQFTKASQDGAISTDEMCCRPHNMKIGEFLLRCQLNYMFH